MHRSDGVRAGPDRQQVKLKEVRLGISPGLPLSSLASTAGMIVLWSGNLYSMSILKVNTPATPWSKTPL